MRPLRFHWSMSSAGDKLRRAKARADLSGKPDIEALVQFCRHAEDCGFESLLTAFSFARPDPLTLASALGMLTTKIKFMVAVRSGTISPTLFTQQVNTVASLTNGRVCVNVVAGHTPDELRYYGDFLDHDERYARTDEFLAVCNAFWRGGDVDFDGKYYRVEKGKLNVPFIAPDRARPELFLGGNSEVAEDLVIRHCDCLWRMPQPVEVMERSAERVLRAGKEVGILTSIIARRTREEAVGAAHALVAETGGEAKKTHEQIERKLDSVAFRAMYAAARDNGEWPAPYLWTGAVPYFGAPSIALVGSFDEMAETIVAYKHAGISQFLFLGWPDLPEMTLFHDEVLPRVRALESAEDDAPREATA